MAKILLVDDDSSVLAFIKRALESHGHSITLASDGLEALTAIYSREYDLVLIDLVLPNITGIEILNALKHRSPKTMAIMISGQADIDSAIESVRLGAYDFLKKPVRTEELLSAVEKALFERKMMKKAGFIYKNIDDNKTSSLSGFIIGFGDFIIVSTVLLLAFIVQSLLMGGSPEILQFPTAIKLSLSLGFCYAFVYTLRKEYRRTELRNDSNYSQYAEVSRRIFKNLSLSYLCFIAILFIFKDVNFEIGKFAIFGGYILALISLIGIRLSAKPLSLLIAQMGLMRPIEGKKKLVVIGSSSESLTSESVVRAFFENRDISAKAERDHQVRAIHINSMNDINQMQIDDDIEQILVDSSKINASQLIALLNRLDGKNIKLRLTRHSSESLKKSKEMVSA